MQIRKLLERQCLIVSLCTVFALLSSCDKKADTTTAPEAEAAQNVDEQANTLFETLFSEWLERSPEFQTWLGIKDDYGQWDNLSEEFAAETHEITKQQLERLHAIDKTLLSDNVALSYRLMEEQLQQELDFYQWRYHNYPVNQMYGTHSSVPSLLINQHTVTDLSDAEAYISRLNSVGVLFDQVISGLNKRAELGIIAPKFVFPLVIESSQNLINGAPFTDGDDTAIWADVQTKINALEIDDAKKAELIASAKKALLETVQPAYSRLITALEAVEEKADERAGAWKFPDGETFYNAALKRTTTTDLSAEEIHALGLREVARIHEEMQAIMTAVGFEGSLQEFFVHLKTDDKYYFEGSEAGREQYLARAKVVLDEITARLDEVFITKPKSELKIKAVEAFREKAAGKAFYQSPPPDGSRPGIYYANLYNMKEMPRYELEALLYHEGLPGHHLQLSISTEMEGVPKFRKFGRYTAYTEGWGLYSEMLPKELGLYQDPYSDFGRLAMELWRACRLVVDTGLHAKQWTREQAIQYLVDNTPTVERGSRRAIERYIVMPSQATAYKIGMLKIIELREKARAELADKFDIREYHEKVLRLGAVPLSVLEEQIEVWIEEKGKSK